MFATKRGMPDAPQVQVSVSIFSQKSDKSNHAICQNKKYHEMNQFHILYYCVCLKIPWQLYIDMINFEALLVCSYMFGKILNCYGICGDFAEFIKSFGKLDYSLVIYSIQTNWLINFNCTAIIIEICP